MSNWDELQATLKKLRLSGVSSTLELREREALEGNLSPTEFMLRLLTDEVERRESKKLEDRMKGARFEKRCYLEDFEWSFNPAIPRSTLLELANCAFIGRRENVLLVGPSGVGKSHVAQSIGERACRLGHKVLYSSAHEFFEAMRAARADESYGRAMTRFVKPELLILDDVGLYPLSGEEPIDLHEVIRRRYESGALVLTSNRSVDELYGLFLDDLLASAAMDRLLHHAHVVEMTGRSYRNPEG